MNEMLPRGIDEQFIIPDQLPKRLVPYFQKTDTMNVDKIRRYFRATDKDEEVRKQRRRMLKRLYKRRFREQFPQREDEMKHLLSREGVQLTTERLNLYPLYFEDWVHKLIRQARQNASAPGDR